MSIWSKHFMANRRLRKANFIAISKCADMIHNSSYNKSIKIILDIGANVGVYSVGFSKFFPESYIHSFEPVLDNYISLEYHIKQANLLDKRVSLYNIGFWKEEATLEVGIPKDRKDINNTGLYKIGGSKLVKKCKFAALDEWNKDRQIVPQLIKIDAEGADAVIVKYGEETVRKADWILVESADKEMQELLKSFGFISHSKFRQDTLWGKSEIKVS